MSNLPNWPAAAQVYSKAYRVLETMAASGHVQRRWNFRGWVCSPSQDMIDLIDALKEGNEEQIKGMLLLPHYFQYQA